jgi:hypothetical protein
MPMFISASHGHDRLIDACRVVQRFADRERLGHRRRRQRLAPRRRPYLLQCRCVEGHRQPLRPFGQDLRAQRVHLGLDVGVVILLERGWSSRERTEHEP